MRSDENLNKLVNQSGFPLQLAVEHLVSTGATAARWRVHSRENGWRASDGKTGFIDLVLEDRWNSSVLVLECKRVAGGEWIFLCESRNSASTLNTRLWISNTAGHGKEHFGYFDALSQPESLQSSYCVVPGQDAKARPMLERIASELAASTEALAAEEWPLMKHREHGIRMYGCAIVTTAKLFSCRLDPSAIVLGTGEVADASYEEVPWVRFRKPFSSERAVEPTSTTWDYSKLATAKEKVVFIVNVLALEAFLNQWSVVDRSLFALM